MFYNDAEMSTAVPTTGTASIAAAFVEQNGKIQAAAPPKTYIERRMVAIRRLGHTPLVLSDADGSEYIRDLDLLKQTLEHTTTGKWTKNFPKSVYENPANAVTLRTLGLLE